MHASRSTKKGLSSFPHDHAQDAWEKVTILCNVMLLQSTFQKRL